MRRNVKHASVSSQRFDGKAGIPLIQRPINFEWTYFQFANTSADNNLESRASCLKRNIKVLRDHKVESKETSQAETGATCRRKWGRARKNMALLQCRTFKRSEPWQGFVLVVSRWTTSHINATKTVAHWAFPRIEAEPFLVKTVQSVSQREDRMFVEKKLLIKKNHNTVLHFLSFIKGIKIN